MKGIKYIVTVVFVFITLLSFSQETKKVAARRKALEKQEVEKKKAADKSIEEGRERHKNIQTKEVKKRMKKNDKRNKKRHKKKAKARRKR
ncbi:MAG: hypothetical protein P8Q14_12160 [Vicingaceae bacterium]|nr:hypothetical protein [Vicingaceae bacterium]